MIGFPNPCHPYPFPATTCSIRGAGPWIKMPDGRLLANPTFLQLPPECPIAYAALAHSCLSGDPKERPLFSHILLSVEAMGGRTHHPPG